MAMAWHIHTYIHTYYIPGYVVLVSTNLGYEWAWAWTLVVVVHVGR